MCLDILLYLVILSLCFIQTSISCTRAALIFFFSWGDGNFFLNVQVKCFNAPLQPSEIVGVKRVVQEKLPEGVNERGLTLTGFLFLHALFIEKGRLETTWTVLRKFGYNNDIKLSDDLIPSPARRNPDQVIISCMQKAFICLVLHEFLLSLVINGWDLKGFILLQLDFLYFYSSGKYLFVFTTPYIILFHKLSYLS